MVPTGSKPHHCVVVIVLFHFAEVTIYSLALLHTAHTPTHMSPVCCSVLSGLRYAWTNKLNEMQLCDLSGAEESMISFFCSFSLNCWLLLLVRVCFFSVFSRVQRLCLIDVWRNVSSTSTITMNYSSNRNDEVHSWENLNLFHVSLCPLRFSWFNL